MLEVFLSKGIKIPKLGLWNWQRYSTTFIQIKGKNNVLADAISRLKNIRYLQRTIEEPKKHQWLVTHKDMLWTMHTTKMHTIRTSMLCTQQKWDITCKKTSITIMPQ